MNPTYILLGVIAIVVIWLIMAYNGLVRRRNQVKNAWAQIDVQLKRRYDLIPNLVEVVKDYMSYEQETLENITKARNLAMGAQTPGEAAKADAQMSSALNGLYMVMENYPDLKANQNVSELQEELTSTENKIGFARQFYNDTVTAYNTRIQVFPTVIVANMTGFKEEELFLLEDEGQREVPKVDLR